MPAHRRAPPPLAAAALADQDDMSDEVSTESDSEPVSPSGRQSPRHPAISYKFTDLRGRYSFLADNEFIVNGYRASLSWSQCFHSVFQLHNETVNVWTHLLGAITFVYLCFYFGLSHLPAHYSQSSCPSEPFVVGGVHTSHMMDCEVFPPYGVATSSCKGMCLPIPALEWVKAGLQERVAPVSAGVMGAVHGVEDQVLHLAGELKSIQVSASSKARQRLGDLRSSVAHQLATVTDKLKTMPAGAKMSQGLTAAKVALTDLAHAVQHASHNLELRVATPLPKWPVIVFLLSAFICLIFSTVFHWFHCVDKATWAMLAKLDYVGIAVLIAGSSVPVMYYGFCNPVLRWGYIGMLVTICTGCIVVSLVDRFSTPAWRTVRMSLYVGAGLSGGLPMGHMAMFSDQAGGPEMNLLFTRVCIMGFLYVFGALLYGFRFPERLWPGKFDYVFSSHQIFHVMVFTAAVVHYIGVTDHYHMRSAMRCVA